MKPWKGTAATSQPGFPISTSSRRANHTPAALAFQVQIDIATLGWCRGSLGSFADLFGLFLASNLLSRWHSSRRDLSIPKTSFALNLWKLAALSSETSIDPSAAQPAEV
jgi:hypothetical protein